MKIAVILPAAGQSRRFYANAESSPDAAAAVLGHSEDAKRSKIELDLAGKPVFQHAVELFLGRPQVGAILLAVDPDKVDEFRFRWGDRLGFHGVQLTPGGKKERWETVLKALEAAPADCTHIAIHDAARPLTSAKLIDAVFEAAAAHEAVIPGLAVSSTLKRVAPLPVAKEKADPLDAIFGAAGKTVLELQRVTQTVDRAGMVEVQTPQVFARELLARAYAQLSSGQLSGAGITDDAGLVEALGAQVVVVPGEPANIKITRPADLELARAVMQSRQGQNAAQLAKRRLFGDDDE